MIGRAVWGDKAPLWDKAPYDLRTNTDRSPHLVFRDY